MENLYGKSALVIGGSMAGLLAARVLSDYFQEVIIVERDTFTDEPLPRKGVPQAHQPHVFLLQGLKILRELFPGMHEELIKAGAQASGPEDWCFITHAGMPVRVDLGRIIGATRSFLEWHVRRRVSSLPNVRFITGVEVTGLLESEDKQGVIGVRLHGRHSREAYENITTDLVVDASGRYSKAPSWLVALGYQAPFEDIVNAGVGYSSRMYRKPDDFPVRWQNALIQPRPPHNARMGVILSVEGDRWHVMMGGVTNTYPPTDDKGFLDWAKSLADPCIYEAIRLCEPLTPIRSFRVPETHFRHFERISRWPKGFVVMGDAVCAFNPFYGQGITVAAMEAEVLRSLFQKGGIAGRERRFQQNIAKVATTAWMIGTGEDLRWSGVTINGKPADLLTRFLHRYMEMLLPAACTYATVSCAFYEVLQMLKPPTMLMHPKVLFRVLWHRLWGVKVPEEAKQALSQDILTQLQARPANFGEFSQPR